MSTSSPPKAESSQQLVQEIRKGNKDAFEKLFYQYYYDLCSLAFKITKCSEQARDVVQDIFLKVWKKREHWHINTSVKAYLYQAVWNEALNKKAKEKTHQKVKEEFSHIALQNINGDHAEFDNRTQKLITEVWRIVDGMAEQRKFVFILYRRHGLSYKEISKLMEITRKTVENHMGLALQEIREAVDPVYFR